MSARRRGIAAGLFAIVGFAGVGCGGGEPSHPAARSSGPVLCRTGFRAPDGFALSETTRVQAPGHVGVRETLEDELGRTINATSGIAGEFGEGGRSLGTLTVATGEEATLSGDRDSWVLVWQVTSVCTPRTVSGSGFSKEEFLSLLESAELVHPAAAIGATADGAAPEGM